MQYILTQSEMDGLVSSSKLDLAKQAIVAMREMIVGDKCIHKQHTYPYCDRCPLSDLGSFRMGVEPPKPIRTISKAMCDLHRRYGK